MRTKVASKTVYLRPSSFFLDYFPESLDVIVSCARKTEIERWPMLFDLVGKPRYLFEKCLKDGKIRTAASYLLVLHNLEGLEDADVSGFFRECP